MTSSLGIAATTAVLRKLLQDAIPAAALAGVMGAVPVTALPPDRIDVTTEASSLNLFMYQVRPNLGWTNSDLPSHDDANRRIINPPLALDLSYMLSAYGAANFHSEILLGYGALLLHQTRQLTRDAVKATFAGGALAPDMALLATAGLEGQEEIVRLSMDPLTTEEISRLWSVFGEKYRPSIAFQASVLLMRATDAAQASGPPVKRVRLATSTSIHPTITSIEPAMVIVGSGAAVDLVGTGLLAADAVVRFGSGEAAMPAVASTPMRVRVTLPPTLRAGVNSARMQLPARFESDLRSGAESNVIPFTLRPTFARTGTGAPDITVGPQTVTGTFTSTTIAVRLEPLLGKRQNASLLLTELDVAAGGVPHTYSIAAPSRDNDVAETTATVSFVVASVSRARYAVRLRVDGAETELGMSADVYDLPAVDLR